MYQPTHINESAHQTGDTYLSASLNQGERPSTSTSPYWHVGAPHTEGTQLEGRKREKEQATGGAIFRAIFP